MVEWWRFFIIFALVMLSALFSGLTLGLMGLDTRNLELLTMGPFEDENAERQAKYAKRILPVRRSGNLLLCTLLLGNVAVNAMLSILLADLTTGYIGFLVSTSLIVLFGEITPQSICARHGLAIGAYTVWIVYFFMILTYVIAKPIAMVLDCILGEELGNILSKNQMKKLFEMYEKDKLLDPDERKLLIAALEMQDKKAKEIMTPMSKIYMLDINTKLTEDKIHEIYLQGFSRVPIFDGKRDNIVGILLVRDLLVINSTSQVVILRHLGSLIIRDIIAVDVDTKLEPILKEFKRGTSHMCIVRKTIDDGVRDPYLQNQGIISLEDIIEEILQDQIEDEIDQEQQLVKRGEGINKQKLIDLFSEKRCSKILSDHERNAVCSYLCKYEIPFKRDKISSKSLEELVAHSHVVNVHTEEQEYDDSSDEEDKKQGIITIKALKDLETSQYDKNDVHIIQSKHLKSNFGNYKSLSAIKVDDINLKFNPDVKSKSQAPNKHQSMPEASGIDGEGDCFENSQSETHNATDTAFNINNDDYDEENGCNRYSIPSHLNDSEINPDLFIRNVPSDSFYLILRGKVEVISGKDLFRVEIGSFS